MKINPISALKAWLKSFRKDTQNIYQPAYWTSQRSWLPGSIQDAKWDISAATRLELLRQARYWECNSPLVQRFIQIYTQYAVGSHGLTCIPNTLSETTNGILKKIWDEASSGLDIQSRDPLCRIQEVIARRVFVDGEIFILKVQQPGSPPQIQLIESHRCLTPSDLRQDEGKNIIDGVRVGPQGEVLGYYFSKRTETNLDTVVSRVPQPLSSYEFDYREASEVIHVGRRERPGQYRFLTMLFSVLNDIHDLHDLQKYEMQSAKAAAIVANVIYTTTGEMPDSQNQRMVKLGLQAQNTADTSITRQQAEFYEAKLGSTTIALRQNEKMEQFKSDRPTVTTQAYWDYMLGKICAGVSIPMLLVFPRSIQGTVARADLDSSSTFFKTQYEMFAAAMCGIYAWRMKWHVDYDKRLQIAEIRDFRSLIIRPPRSVNVDVGYKSREVIDGINNNLMTYTQALAEQGLDFKEVTIQKSEELAFIKKAAIDASAKFGVDIEPQEINHALFEVMEPNEPEPEEKEEANAV